MEPNVLFWIRERRSFVQRLLMWTELLEPTNLITSIEKIEKSRQLLFTSEDASRFNMDDERIKNAWKRSLSTVHPDSSRLIPVLFRPAAFLPLTVPMVFLSMMPAKGMKSLILSQVSLYTYTTGFTIVNGNASYGVGLPTKIFLGAGVVVSSTFFGLIPHLIQMKYPLANPLIRRALPVIFLAQVSGMNVFTSRSLDRVRGIEVMDKEGNVIGRSRRAGRKAVKETAISRAVLFGTSAFIPEVFAYFFKRTQFFLQNPQSLWTVKLSCTLLVMGLMVPVSFSMFPQIGQVFTGRVMGHVWKSQRLEQRQEVESVSMCGPKCQDLLDLENTCWTRMGMKIKYSKLEEEIQALTKETELFYHRGV